MESIANIKKSVSIFLEITLTYIVFKHVGSIRSKGIKSMRISVVRTVLKTTTSLQLHACLIELGKGKPYKRIKIGFEIF